MSEQAKPVCIHCGLPIHGTAYGGAGEWRHYSTTTCSVAQIREIDLLRAENARLREELAQRREHMRRGIEAGRPTGGVG